MTPVQEHLRIKKSLKIKIIVHKKMKHEVQESLESSTVEEKTPLPEFQQ